LHFAPPCIAFLLAQFTLKKEAYIALSNIISLGLSFISGAFVPQFLLSEGVLTLARFTPTYWFVKANNTIAEATVSGEVLKNILGYIGIEFLFTLAFFVLSLAIAKSNRRKES
jgi:ABC-2 type transport system permease protein